MIVVTVKIEVDAEHQSMFKNAALKQAEVTLDRETGCLKFEVYTDPRRRSNFLLLETYESQGAYDHHLVSEHYRTFDQISAPWVAMKEVEIWELEIPREIA
ncbi:MAG: putative quinol monooxygenase [Pseudomonadota bacterium]